MAVAEFRLPRLQRDADLIDGSKPTMLFQRWWQSVVEKIEGALNNIRQLLIDVGIAQATADGGVEIATDAFERADSAIEPGGTIRDNKVETSSVAVDAITERYFAKTLGSVTLPTGIETDVVSVTITKVLNFSEMDIDVAVRLASDDDILGTIRIYRGMDLVDSFPPFLKGPGGTYRTILTMPFTENDIPAGTYDYRVTFQKDSGATTLQALSGTLIRIKEIKR